MKSAGAVFDVNGWRAAVVEGDPGREPRAVQLLPGLFGSQAEAVAAAAERIRPKGVVAESEPESTEDAAAEPRTRRTRR